jgi:hypothetical protein
MKTNVALVNFVCLYSIFIPKFSYVSLVTVNKMNPKLITIFNRSEQGGGDRKIIDYYSLLWAGKMIIKKFMHARRIVLHFFGGNNLS